MLHVLCENLLSKVISERYDSVLILPVSFISKVISKRSVQKVLPFSNIEASKNISNKVLLFVNSDTS